MLVLNMALHSSNSATDTGKLCSDSSVPPLQDFGISVIELTFFHDILLEISDNSDLDPKQ